MVLCQCTPEHEEGPDHLMAESPASIPADKENTATFLGLEALRIYASSSRIAGVGIREGADSSLTGNGFMP